MTYSRDHIPSPPTPGTGPYFTADLVVLVRELRRARGLTQAEVAARVVGRDGHAVTRSAIARAEDASVDSQADGLRIKVVEALTGCSCAGPAYFFERWSEDAPRGS